MKGKNLILLSVAALLVLLPGSPCPGGDPEMIVLPAPRFEGGRPLMQALKDRKSVRIFSGQALSDQVLGELLWAAYGVNRPDSLMRTAPSAHNRQEIDIYVTTAKGLYLYKAVTHALELVSSEDIRALTGKQEFPGHAPANFVYVADFSRMPGVPRQAGIEAAAVSTGAIAQNVYLYCASEGLAAVARGWIDRPALGKAMNLRDDQYIVLAQTVGYPGEHD